MGLKVQKAGFRVVGGFRKLLFPSDSGPHKHCI